MVDEKSSTLLSKFETDANSIDEYRQVEGLHPAVWTILAEVEANKECAANR